MFSLIRFFQKLKAENSTEKKLLSALKKETGKLNNTYSEENLESIEIGASSYPRVNTLNETGIYAYHVSLMPCGEDLARLMDLVLKKGFTPGNQNNQGLITSANKTGKSLTINYCKELNGITAIVITNSADFINELVALKIKPPAPWETFPNIDPNSIGSMQGSMDYWWRNYWTPFWSSLSKLEKQEYFSSKKATDEWIELIETHENWG